MKTLLFSAVLAVAGVSTAAAQAPVVVKTKGKVAGQPSVKSKVTKAPQARPAAEDGPSDELLDSKANSITANMQQNLNLTPAQVEKVRVINRRAVEQVEVGRARYGTDPRKLAGIVESAGHARLEFIKDALTPEQFNKYQRKREEKMGIPAGQGPRGNPVPGLGNNMGDQ